MRFTNPYNSSLRNPASWAVVLFVPLFFFGVMNPIWKRHDSWVMTNKLNANAGLPPAYLKLGPLSISADSAKTLMYMFFIFSFSVAKPVFALINKRYGRKIGDADVQALAEAVMDGKTDCGEFGLYLRPHWIDEYTPPYKNPHHKGFGAWFNNETCRLDDALSLEINLPVISIGTKTMQLATGAITVPDKDWKNLVDALIRKAKVIFLVPAATKGVCIEIEKIKTLAMENKTILLQPPEFGGVTTVNSRVQEHWEKIRNPLLTQFSLRLPKYDAYGSVTHLGIQPDKSTTAIAENLGLSLRQYRPAAAKPPAA